MNRNIFIKAFQETMAITITLVIALICDIILSNLLALPFSLVTKNWTLWVTVLVILVKVQLLVLTLYTVWFNLERYTKLGDYIKRKRLERKSRDMQEIWDRLKKGEDNSGT